MISALQRQATRRWLRRYGKGGHVPAVRAVFLGDAISNRIILDGVFAGRELDVLSREVFPHLARPATALDIGANIGNHANHFATYFDRVVAFEPNPPVAAVLRANTMGGAVEVVETALSDAPGTLNFSVNRLNLGGSHITPDPSDVTVQADTLDRLAGSLRLEDVRFVKIDVERHEAEVLAGAATLLSTQRPVIAMEGHYKSHPEIGKRVASRLDSLGYRYFYRLAARRFACFDRHYGSLRWILPRFLRPSFPLTLVPVESVAGRDHDLVVAATDPLHQ